MPLFFLKSSAISDPSLLFFLKSNALDRVLHCERFHYINAFRGCQFEVLKELSEKMAYKLRPRFQSSSTIYADKGCQLSNDPPEDGETQELSLCHIRQYQCKSAEEDVDELLIAYQYELFLKKDAVDQDLAKEYLEEAMLEQLAIRTGTFECGETDRGIFSNVLGVNRAPNDTVDSRFDSCVTPPMEGTVCVPMLGGSTVFLPSSNRTVHSDDRLVASMVDFIRIEMENDVYVQIGSIEKVVFVNRSVSVNDMLDGDNMSTKPRASGLESGTKVGVATGAALFFLLLLLLLLLSAKRNQRQARVLEEPDDDEFTGNGSLAKKDSLALKPRYADIAQTPPRKIVSKDAVQTTTPETPESDISFDESPTEKLVQSSASPTSIMARADSNRRSDSIMTFAARESEAAEKSSTPKQRVASSTSDVEAPEASVSPVVRITGLLAPAFSEDSDTVSDFDQGCCMGFNL